MKRIFCLLLFPIMLSAQTMSKTDTLTFSRDASVLDEHRSLGKQVDDFQQTFPAVKIDPKTMKAVKATAEFRLDGQPLLWFAADKSKAVLDARVFGDLTMVNVTTLGEGKTAVVGRIKEPGRTLAPRAVAWFLMRSGILQTFVHLESTVKLDGEKTAGGRYEAAFSGKHLYYTNERHESAFRFRFIIEADGTLRVES
jgi:hypothetical protein